MLVGHSRAARIFSDDEVLFLKTVGTFLAYAIAAARSASSFRALVENAPDVIVRFDGDLRITYDNDPGRFGDNGALPAEIFTGDFPVPSVFRLGAGMPFRLSPDASHALALAALRVPTLWHVLGATSRVVDRRLEAEDAEHVVRDHLGRRLPAQIGGGNGEVVRAERAGGDRIAALMGHEVGVGLADAARDTARIRAEEARQADAGI